MYYDDKSMSFQLIFNQHLVPYNKFISMNPMGISSPWGNYKKQTIIHEYENKTNNLKI